MATLPTRTAPPRPPSLSERLSGFHDQEMARLRFTHRVEMARLGVPASPATSPEAAAAHAAFRDEPREES
jgi:hypothetical protein